MAPLKSLVSIFALATAASFPMAAMAAPAVYAAGTDNSAPSLLLDSGASNAGTAVSGATGNGAPSLISATAAADVGAGTTGTASFNNTTQLAQGMQAICTLQPALCGTMSTFSDQIAACIQTSKDSNGAAVCPEAAPGTPLSANVSAASANLVRRPDAGSSTSSGGIQSMASTGSGTTLQPTTQQQLPSGTNTGIRGFHSTPFNWNQFNQIQKDAACTDKIANAVSQGLAFVFGLAGFRAFPDGSMAIFLSQKLGIQGLLRYSGLMDSLKNADGPAAQASSLWDLVSNVFSDLDVTEILEVAFADMSVWDYIITGVSVAGTIISMVATAGGAFIADAVLNAAALASTVDAAVTASTFCSS